MTSLQLLPLSPPYWDTGNDTGYGKSLEKTMEFHSARFLSPEASRCGLRVAVFSSCLYMVTPAYVFVLISCVCLGGGSCWCGCVNICMQVSVYICSHGYGSQRTNMMCSSIACYLIFQIYFLVCVCVCMCSHMCECRAHRIEKGV